jgi:hypothetical protein
VQHYFIATSLQVKLICFCNLMKIQVVIRRMLETARSPSAPIEKLT